MPNILFEEESKRILKECKEDIENNLIKKDLISKYLSDESWLYLAIKEIKNLPLEEKKERGKILYKLREEIKSLINSEEEIVEEQIDFSLPVYPKTGNIHPISLLIREISTILSQMGFLYEDSPEIEDEWRTFEVLNIEKNHPAREDFQSFYLDNNKVLRPHTSSIQSYSLIKYSQQEEIKVFTIGRTFRRDNDRTHTPMFHQLEVLYVSDKANMNKLINDIKFFLKCLFHKDIDIRIRNSYFPFTEPSAEVDAYINNEWIELLGCGMIHPQVFLKSTNKKAKGYAYGCGIERLAMLKRNIKDIRDLYGEDLSSLKGQPTYWSNNEVIS